MWKLDRLGRSLGHLVQTLQGRGVGFRSLQESLDTTSSGGKLVFHFFAALTELEHSRQTILRLDRRVPRRWAVRRTEAAPPQFNDALRWSGSGLDFLPTN